MDIIIPLKINKKGLSISNDTKLSIDAFISLLLHTPCRACVADPQFGFVFNNLRFEIFDENEGVIYNAEKANKQLTDLSDLYSKKISGSSKNLNTFATELKTAIIRYEKRLADISVTMTYIREEKNIYVTVKGVIADTKAEYQYNTHIKIWN